MARKAKSRRPQRRAPKKRQALISWPSFLTGVVCGCVISIMLLTYGTNAFDRWSQDPTLATGLPTQINGTEYPLFEEVDRLETSEAEPSASIPETPDTSPPESQATPASDAPEPSSRSANREPADPSDSDDSLGQGEWPRVLRQIDDGTEGFGVQVGSFKDRSHADSLRASLLLKGYNAQVAAVRRGQDEVWYRIVVGPYPDLAEARTAAAALKDQDITAFWMELRD